MKAESRPESNRGGPPPPTPPTIAANYQIRSFDPRHQLTNTNRHQPTILLYEQDPVKMTLTPSLTLIFTDRFTISARFTCEGATREFDLGMKLSRTTSYLDGMDHTILAQPNRTEPYLNLI